MPKLNLISPITPGAQAAEADQGSIEIINGYVDKLSGNPVIKTRPGLALLNTLDEAARVDTYWWEAKRVLIIVCGSRIYYKTTLAGAAVEITPSTGNTLAYNVKVLFSADEYGVTMTTGLNMVWWNGVTAEASRITDSNAPDEITSLTYLKGYTIASKTNTQAFAWATYGPTDSRSQPPPWSAINLSASSQPDDLIVLESGWEELFLLGRESVESQYVTGDATVPFASIAGSVGEVGIVNNKVLQKMLNTWIFLTPNRQVVMMNGRSPQVVSDPVGYVFQEMDNFNDVESFVLFERFYILNFRSENTTYVYDTKFQLWYRWEYWDRTYKKYVKYLGVTAAHAKSWEKHVVGGFDGKLYVTEYAEVTDNTNLIRGKILSAHIDHGSLDRKFVNEIKLRIRRGY
jgi:hypothetical protein